ncbi:hypothetical protein Dimus_012137 [Dionaea muscipula]
MHVAITRMIPSKYLPKFGSYKIEMDDGVPLKVNVVDTAVAIDHHLKDMRNIAAKSNPSVVGLDLRFQQTQSKMPQDYQILVLCGSDRCLIVQLDYLDYLPQSLIGFLTDPNVCHVGIAINEANCGRLKPRLFRGSQSLKKAGVDVGELAATVFCKPFLQYSPLAEIAKEAGVKTTSRLDSKLYNIYLNSKIFSTDEVKDLATNALLYYKIGHKLLSVLEAL